MPIYDYHCKSCGKNFEIQHKMAESAPANGPDCGQASCALEKQMSRVAASVRSPNPFMAQSGRPVSGDQGLFTTTKKAEEKTHNCTSTCAMHSH